MCPSYNKCVDRSFNRCLNQFFVKELSEDLIGIDSRLRVKPNPGCVVRSACKNFSLVLNYSKGCGDDFTECVED